MGQAGRLLLGRADERRRLLQSVRGGFAGDPRAVLVRGEAGVGKTSLVRSLCDEVAADGAQVLWGQGLRFGAVDAMFHPLVLALEGWLRTADSGRREEVLTAVPSAALILPSLGGPPTTAPSGLMMLVDALVEHVVGQDPTVVVVDDVQWADQGTWDALTYLVAGFGAQRLALVTTHRDEAVVSDGFQRWLGNLQRLRGTEDLALPRLDEAATRDQVAALLGGPAEKRLAAQVYERSRGNPYLSELLVRRLDPASSELPDELPDELGRALLDSWRELSPPAQEITRILAIGGRPCDVRALSAVANQLALTSVGAVREAADHGVVVLEHDVAWFRHPLIATVLVQSYLPGEAAPVHAAWAQHVEKATSGGVDELRRLGDLALHHEQAGEGWAAFADLTAGADLAETLRAPRERANMLVHAADLWDMSPDPADAIGQAELLERASLACAGVGRPSDSVYLMTRARDVVPPDQDPLRAGRLTGTAAVFASDDQPLEVTLAEVERAVELTRCAPDSRDHAVALSRVAYFLRSMGNAREAWRAADASLETAQRSDSPAAMSMALRVRTYLALDNDFPSAEKHASACWRYAVASGEERIMRSALDATFNVAYASGDLERVLALTREQFDWCVPHGLALTPSCSLSSVALDLGDLRTAESVVRGGLASSGLVIEEVQIRVNAGALAVRQGDRQSARDHVARAYELMPDLENRLWDFPMPVGTVADVRLGLGQSTAVFELVERVLPATELDARGEGRLLVFGARAAADLVQEALDRREQDAAQRHREALDRLVSTRDSLRGVPFETTGPNDTVQLARKAVFDAELARASGVSDVEGVWQEAATACAKAGMQWEQRLSQLRLATAMVDSGARGRDVADLLRVIYGYAVAQGAPPLKDQVKELAASVRVSLDDPVTPLPEARPTPFSSLTQREVEVLSHLVANRTYAEIAEALFISEKTVSTHISNLLRKTDTGSRREVAALARRVGWGTGE